MTDTSSAAMRRAFDTVPHPTKTPRDRLVQISVETDPCPQVALRILGLVARDGSIPVSILIQREDGGLHIELELDTIIEPSCEQLKHRIEAIPTVRKAVMTP